MNVFLESNFILEAALLQEQYASCEEFMEMAEAGNVQLVIPAYSIAESSTTIASRNKRRRMLQNEFKSEVQLLLRSNPSGRVAF